MTDLSEFSDTDLPEGLGPDDFDNDDFGDIVVDFSSEEAASKALEALPTGKYNVTITGVELKKSSSEKNPGKPMYNLKMQVFEGPYTKRTVYSMVMLWAGAAYSLNQLMQATGFPTNAGAVKVPKPNQLIGKQLTIRGIKKPADEKKGYDERFEVKGYMALKPGTGVSAAGSDSLEP